MAEYKTCRIEGLRSCAFDHTAPVMEQNSGKKFRVRCPACNAQTAWGKKLDVVIEWFNRNHTITELLWKAQTGQDISQGKTKLDKTQLLR